MKYEERVMVENIYRCSRGNNYRNVPDELVDTIKKHFTAISQAGSEYRLVFPSEWCILDHINLHPALKRLVDNA